MIIHQVGFSSFRNLQDTSAALSPRFTFVVGKNAQGKTNFLEAVSLVAELSSFRKAALKDLVTFNHQQALLSCEADSAGLDYQISLLLAKGSRRLKVNGKAVTRHKDHLGRLPLVTFTPDDVRLSQGGPQRRRQFLDRALFLFDPSHWDRCTDYNKHLKRRNILLKEQKSNDPLFEVYTEKLAQLGAQISQARLLMSKKVEKRMVAAVSTVSENHDQISLNYNTYLKDDITDSIDNQQQEGNIQLLLEKLNRHLLRDRRVGYTTAGPHVEDLEIKISERAATSFASQGQHRTIALALKIAEIEVVHDVRGIFPTLLIDDLSSELDSERRERLFAYLRSTGGQVVLTATDQNIAQGFSGEECIVYNVSNGQLTKIADY